MSPVVPSPLLPSLASFTSASLPPPSRAARTSSTSPRLHTAQNHGILDRVRTVGQAQRPSGSSGKVGVEW